MQVRGSYKQFFHFAKSYPLQMADLDVVVSEESDVHMGKMMG